jgi:hypothetical protein
MIILRVRTIYGAARDALRLWLIITLEELDHAAGNSRMG